MAGLNSQLAKAAPLPAGRRSVHTGGISRNAMEPAPHRLSRFLRAIRRLAIVCGAGFALLVAVFGYTAKVTPPATVRSAATVYVIQDELHIGLVLPERGGFVEFGFGDWEWYARAQDRWYHAFATVLLPTPGTLARREHAVASVEALQSSMPWVRLQPITVDYARAEALRLRLQAQFAARESEAVYRTGLRTQFVPWDRSYWFGDNCATAVVEWLRELDCTASWAPLLLAVSVATARG